MRDRVLRIVTPTNHTGWFARMRVDPNTPVLLKRASSAMRLDADTAEKIRFNLTARGYKVTVVFEDDLPIVGTLLR